MNWLGVPKNPTSHLGFIYMIKNMANHRFYIGKKLFWFKKGNKLVESDWKTYYGSSKDLTADIEKYGKKNFRRCMIFCFDTKWDLMYQELLYQLKHDVMNDPLAYNGIINVRLRKRKDGTKPKNSPILPR